MSLLSVRDLRVTAGDVRPVDGVSLDVVAGETLCLVGESGAGKTTLCEALVGLNDGDAAGEVTFDGADLLGAPERFRGERIGLVFQDATASLNPVTTARAAVAEPLRTGGIDRRRARERAEELLARVGAGGVANAHPHELSGGQARRVALAAALAGDPDLLVLDEPTAGLDAPTARSVLSLLSELQDERDLAVLLVTHDLGSVAAVGDRAVVLYGGAVAERASVDDLFERPAHPYTRALLAALPGDDLPTPIPGSPPDPVDPPEGCRFHPRCPHATDDCRTGARPPEHEHDGRDVSCVYYGPGYDPAALDG